MFSSPKQSRANTKEGEKKKLTDGKNNLSKYSSSYIPEKIIQNGKEILQLIKKDHPSSFQEIKDDVTVNIFYQFFQFMPMTKSRYKNKTEIMEEVYAAVSAIMNDPTAVYIDQYGSSEFLIHKLNHLLYKTFFEDPLLTKLHEFARSIPDLIFETSKKNIHGIIEKIELEEDLENRKEEIEVDTINEEKLLPAKKTNVEELRAILAELLDDIMAIKTCIEERYNCLDLLVPRKTAYKESLSKSTSTRADVTFDRNLTCWDATAGTLVFFLTDQSTLHLTFEEDDFQEKFLLKFNQFFMIRDALMGLVNGMNKILNNPFNLNYLDLLIKLSQSIYLKQATLDEFRAVFPANYNNPFIEKSTNTINGLPKFIVPDLGLKLKKLSQQLKNLREHTFKKFADNYERYMDYKTTWEKIRVLTNPNQRESDKKIFLHLALANALNQFFDHDGKINPEIADNFFSGFHPERTEQINKLFKEFFLRIFLKIDVSEENDPKYAEIILWLDNIMADDYTTEFLYKKDPKNFQDNIHKVYYNFTQTINNHLKVMLSSEEKSVTNDLITNLKYHLKTLSMSGKNQDKLKQPVDDSTSIKDPHKNLQQDIFILEDISEDTQATPTFEDVLNDVLETAWKNDNIVTINALYEECDADKTKLNEKLAALFFSDLQSGTLNQIKLNIIRSSNLWPKVAVDAICHTIKYQQKNMLLLLLNNSKETYLDKHNDLGVTPLIFAIQENKFEWFKEALGDFFWIYQKAMLTTNDTKKKSPLEYAAGQKEFACNTENFKKLLMDQRGVLFEPEQAVLDNTIKLATEVALKNAISSRDLESIQFLYHLPTKDVLAKHEITKNGIFVDTGPLKNMIQQKINSLQAEHFTKFSGNKKVKALNLLLEQIKKFENENNEVVTEELCQLISNWLKDHPEIDNQRKLIATEETSTRVLITRIQRNLFKDHPAFKERYDAICKVDQRIKQLKTFNVFKNTDQFAINAFIKLRELLFDLDQPGSVDEIISRWENSEVSCKQKHNQMHKQYHVQNVTEIINCNESWFRKKNSNPSKNREFVNQLKQKKT